jgi:hypothetical protein
LYTEVKEIRVYIYIYPIIGSKTNPRLLLEEVVRRFRGGILTRSSGGDKYEANRRAEETGRKLHNIKTIAELVKTRPESSSKSSEGRRSS